MHPENVVVLEATNLKPELSTLKDDPSIIDIYNRIPEFKKLKEDRKNAKVLKRIRSTTQETIYENSFYNSI